MKLYKYRSLASEEQIKRVLQIIKTGLFYCGYWESQNDPMEGMFRYFAVNPIYEEDLRNLLSEKSNLRICSFSNTVHSILQWAYYAHGFQGIAIELTLNSKKFTNLYRVNYENNIPDIYFPSHAVGQNATSILTTKLSFWKHEKEYRFITDDELLNLRPYITAVYFGMRIKDGLKLKVRSECENHGVRVIETKLDIDNKLIIPI